MFYRFLKPLTVVLSVSAIPVFFLLSPISAVLLLSVALICGIILIKRRTGYAIRVPAYLNKPDPSEDSYSGKPVKGRGVLFLGREKHTDREIWLSNSDMRQHFLVLGSTGSGKTELLLGMAANVITAGGGCIYFETNGDAGVYARIYDICRRAGRENDIFILNFYSRHEETTEKVGHKWNPFETSSDQLIISTLTGMMMEVGGDGAMWKGRATAMLSGVVRALVWLRDNQGHCLDARVIREFMNLNKIISLAKEGSEYGIPDNIIRSLQAYLNSLPGYKEEKGVAQAQTTLDQHGYLEMQFSQILGSLGDIYGLTLIGKSDFTMSEIYENRRILIVMLPALEKSGDEIANLGKMVVLGIRGMMSDKLSSGLEGNWDDIVKPQHINGSLSVPFMCILDNCGYYIVEGMALMAAQARSAGFSMVYASQDISAMQRNNEKEAASIIANTNTKIFMRTEAAGTNSIINGINNTVPDKRISFVELAKQSAGDMTIAFRGEIIRARAFSAASEENKTGWVRNTAGYGVRLPDIGENL